MAADLQPVRALAQMVGVVDGPGGQPAQALVEQAQGVEVGRGGLLQHGGGLSGGGGEKR
jgi:hypothetical protein